MKQIRLSTLLVFILILAACGGEEEPSPTIETARPTATTVLTEVEPQPEENVATPQVTQAESEAGGDPQAEAPPTGEDTLPQPTLFEQAWDDRELFRRGLLEDEQDIVDTLTGATVYHMQLAIDELTQISGQMEVLYTNQEEVPLNEIYFHLFANQLGGSITVSDVRLNGESLQPETVSTALRVPLEDGLNPGEQAVVQMNFVTTVPPADESTKYNILAFNEDILALAHFYPMIATYDDQGWHTEPSPPNGDETYADMSYFLVQLRAPAEQIVVASGVEVERVDENTAQTVTLAAGPVRDFYLAMSDRYGVVSDQIGGVQINSYAPRELLEGAEWALEAAGYALQIFSERYGPYPYNELDIVSTPTQALGIEYPGIFANALRIYDVSDSGANNSANNTILLESVTVHETAHQWFYNLVGNDQINEPWLDEATAQYATWMYYNDRYGEGAGEQYYSSLEGRWARADYAEIPIGLPAEVYDGVEYGAIVYGRGPIFLDELAQQMGQEPFDAFMRDYVQSYRWQIASSEDFQALAEQHCQCDLSMLFDQAVYAQ